jgi:hypothetical protein
LRFGSISIAFSMRRARQSRKSKDLKRLQGRTLDAEFLEQRPRVSKASQSWSRTLPQIFACFSCLFQFVTDQINSRMRLNRIKERLADWPGEVAAQ